VISNGSRLGPYEILAPIGAGGMGEVYRARDERLKREVAIKVLPVSFSTDPDRLRRFEQEAQAAGALNHPNITAVYDIGQHDNAPYVVQELLEGETLRVELSGGRFSPRKAIDYALQITQGLAAAHDKGIVHRDLKPENLFVTKDGRVKILDFGLAKLTQVGQSGAVTNLPTVTPGTEPGVVMGTLGYMSPEQVKGRPADARSDIFSFGAIFYEMLSGKRAFHADSAGETMAAILREEPPDLSVTNENISPGLERILRHCLEKNPERRFQSASDIAFDLEALSTRSGVSAATAAVPGRAFARARTALAAAALIALGAAAGIFAVARRLERRAPAPSFHRQTFRRGFIASARFAPDGQTIVYSAAWDGNPIGMFTTRAGSTESSPLSLPSADVFSISSSGEMALLLHRPPGIPDMLARAALAGGAPREILANVVDADWTPDGKNLAIIRRGERGEHTLELPVGKVLSRSTRLIALRVSPAGDRIAIIAGDSNESAIGFVDLSGKKRLLSGGWYGARGLAWSPDGREIWFTQATREGPPNLYAVDLAGKVRPVLKMPSWIWLHDIARDGRALIGNNSWRAGVNWLRAGETREQDVSWLDWSIVADLSRDGKSLLFSESREGGSSAGAVFLRGQPNAPPVRLGDGEGLALSPDGKWALASVKPAPERPAQLVLLPTGAGEQKVLATGNLKTFNSARWLEDGKRFLLRAGQADELPRLLLCDLAGSPTRAISPPGASGLVVSPDGKLAATRLDRKIRIYPVDKGEPSLLPGQLDGETPIEWSADGRSIYVYRFDSGDRSVRVYRVRVETGERELWKEIVPPDPAGIEFIGPILMTPDASSYVYTYQRRSSDLYVVEGLR
jgi:dipeptidyl aminopeptidase/acylaminoacyl peptidase